MNHRKPGKLGTRPGHIYVTRAATLEYQKLTRAPFETARRALTERLFSAMPDPENHGTYLLPIHGDVHLYLRVWVSQEGQLLTVPKIQRIPSPLTGANGAGYTDSPTIDPKLGYE